MHSIKQKALLNKAIFPQRPALWMAAIFLASLDVSLLPPNALGQYQFQLLKSFGSAGDEAHPSSLVQRWVQGSDGALYGVTSSGGSNNLGTYFKLNTDGTGYSLLHNFADDDAQYPLLLLQGNDGALYGTAATAADGTGVIFKIGADGSGYTVLHNFKFTGSGWAQPTALVQGSDAFLYGVTTFGGSNQMGTFFKLSPDGSSYTLLHEYRTNDNVQYPHFVIQGKDATLYGISGAAVFKLAQDGISNSILHNRSDSERGYGGEALIQASDGTLYGVFSRNGSGSDTNSGVAFRIEADGSSYTVLHYFSNDEGRPAALVEGTDGALFGATERLVFRMRNDASEYIRLADLNGTCGAQFCLWVSVPLLAGSDGTLFGTTAGGGELGLGTVFTLAKPPQMLPPALTSSGVTIRFTSVAASKNRIQRAITLDGAWETVGISLAPPNGLVEFTDFDSVPLHGAAFYRVLRE